MDPHNQWNWREPQKKPFVYSHQIFGKGSQQHSMGGKSVQQTVVGNLGNMKNKIISLSKTTTKINLQWSKDLYSKKRN